MYQNGLQMYVSPMWDRKVECKRYIGVGKMVLRASREGASNGIAVNNDPFLYLNTSHNVHIEGTQILEVHVQIT